jgi:hypothetical protein
MVCMGYSGLLVTMHHPNSHNAGSTTVPLLLAMLGTLRLGPETRPTNMRIVNVTQANKILLDSHTELYGVLYDICNKTWSVKVKRFYYVRKTE